VLTCQSCGRESPDAFAFCGACGTAFAPVAAAREVRKVVTVVFCDVSGSTALGERLDPEAMRRTMGRYFEEIRGHASYSTRFPADVGGGRGRPEGRPHVPVPVSYAPGILININCPPSRL